ncbi:Hypothetical protein FKW44_013727 [Caligus rogercresseyi]|uniref:Uncharacterized protein n=1 Tax=Caligus rogercresseyi TaxID=217165 RepID=A0A7T8GXZ9_CALRO|nr:Hypothetical protein FKW44_013727 [Caligus rogercresseyi]
MGSIWSSRRRTLPPLCSRQRASKSPDLGLLSFKSSAWTAVLRDEIGMERGFGMDRCSLGFDSNLFT